MSANGWGVRVGAARAVLSRGTAACIASAALAALAACGGGGSSSGASFGTSYSVGGSVSGLSAAGLMLGNAGETLSVPSGASSFTFANRAALGAAYAVTVVAQATGLTCSVSAGTGTVAAGNVGNVQVSCATQAFSIGGSLFNVSAPGLILANGADTVSPAVGASSYVFTQKVAVGGSYNVVVQRSANGLACIISGPSAGVMGTAAVTTINVTCVPPP